MVTVEKSEEGKEKNKRQYGCSLTLFTDRARLTTHASHGDVVPLTDFIMFTKSSPKKDQRTVEQTLAFSLIKRGKQGTNDQV